MSPIFRTQVLRLFSVLFLMLGFLFVLILLNTRTKRAQKECEVLEKRVAAAQSQYEHLLADTERAYRPGAAGVDRSTPGGLQKIKPEQIRTVRFVTKPEIASRER